MNNFKSYTIQFLEKNNFFNMAQKYFNKSSHAVNETSYRFTKEEINSLQNWSEADNFCSQLNRQIWPIFRNEYGRDRKNDGKALEEKARPFEIQFGAIRGRVQELRVEETKKNGTSQKGNPLSSN
ncbi:hypothetical protein [Enterococcus sp.]|uniref:hypothetical protein n=1 Tax=Enterococcus sp. TaxID=35783 RepID=UPI0029103497|nr:hypothetical protein [Enterococcus sp.]MDU5337151.1 hypothetical protein [Enterococcus sp.]